MNRQQKPDITQMVSPFLLVFILHASQIGEGILSFERQISKVAGYDSWISVLLTGLATTIIVILIWRIVSDNNDLIDVHSEVFGKVIGKSISFLFGLYFFSVAITVLRSYIEIIQIWLFRDLDVTLFLIILYLLILYIVLGGFRIVVGFAFFSVFITLFLAIFNYAAFSNGYIDNLLPILNSKWINIIKGIEPMTFGFLGIELILIYAPFIHRFKTGLKWAVIGNGLTTIFYLFSTLAMFVYYNIEQLQKITWPALQLWKVIDFPFVERFEFIGISLHFIAIIASSNLYFWAGTQCLHRISNISFKKIAILFSLIGVFSVFYINSFLMIEKLTTFISKFGVYLLFGYIPLLFILRTIVQGGVKNKHG
ncbi:spore germination protein [Gracilibacillus boraciitolerans JCM 21714]|uniref:Spore germination protein n=1 Tax=Gracilibacillus boraciitolerans JCM 21714 TaxID=1298598 RepID=W4VHF9_9BACI|nr:GerAB/ArcD/ProY family transporter [Gracilibacillus boraciitolerans]GAE92835.1 spore germination protein [Gracilibacillus boraciitolerans JCM 21714]